MTAIATCYADAAVQPRDPQWGRYVTIHRDNTASRGAARFVCSTVGAMSKVAESSSRCASEQAALDHATQLGYPIVVR